MPGGYFADRRSEHQRLVQAAAVAGDHHLAAVGADRLAAPVGDDPAGARDQGDGRLDVPGLQAGLDDHVHLAHGDHGVGVGVAAQAGQPGGGAHLQPGAAFGPVETGVRIGGGDDRVGQLGALAHPDRPLAVPRQQARAGGRADEDLARIGLADRAQHRTSLMAQADQGGPQRQAGDEGARAVDRVQDPDELGVRAVFAILLADHAVIGIALGDQLADRRLGAAVGFRHRIEGGVAFTRQVLARALVFQPVVGPEQRQDRRRRSAVEVDDEGVELSEVIGGEGHGAGFSPPFDSTPPFTISNPRLAIGSPPFRDLARSSRRRRGRSPSR